MTSKSAKMDSRLRGNDGTMKSARRLSSPRKTGRFRGPVELRVNPVVVLQNFTRASTYQKRPGTS
jgi:hypothetical protein